MNTVALTAIAGILLVSPNNIADDQLEAAKISLLLAWLAAKKENPSTVSIDIILSTLGKIGWVLQESKDVKTRIPFAHLSQNLWKELFSEQSNAQDFIAVVSSSLPSFQQVINAWWQQLKVSNCSAPFPLPVVTLSFDSSGLLIELVAPKATLLSSPKLYLDTPSEYEVQAYCAKATLNMVLFEGVKATIEEKIIKYRDLIIQ